MKDHGPTRREFLYGAAAAACLPRLRPHAAESLRRLAGSGGTAEGAAGTGAADDERYWGEVRKAFDLPEGLINLDNGNINPSPRAVVDDLVRHARAVEQFPVERTSDLGRKVLGPVVQPGLAELLGVPGDEIALVRNATEAMDTVLLGVPLARGDEVLCSTHDYYAMLDCLEQRRARDGITLRMIRPPVPAPSLDALAELYEAAISPRTRLVLLTQPSNLTGQLLPIRRIADAAHRVGAEVALDGAQSFALLDYALPETGCDYFGASLHKWLSAPIGAGVLWMRKEHVDKVWPLFPPPSGARGVMRFMRSGTSPLFIAGAIAPALELQHSIGTKRKAARMRYLTRYWRERVGKLPGVRFYTSEDPAASCGLATFEMDGVPSEKLKETLWQRDRILVQDMLWGGRTPEVRGVRVTPNVYTSLANLDRFVAAVERIRARGL